MGGYFSVGMYVLKQSLFVNIIAKLKPLLTDEDITHRWNMYLAYSFNLVIRESSF